MADCGQRARKFEYRSDDSLRVVDLLPADLRGVAGDAASFLGVDLFHPSLSGFSAASAAKRHGRLVLAVPHRKHMGGPRWWLAGAVAFGQRNDSLLGRECCLILVQINVSALALGHKPIIAWLATFSAGPSFQT